MGAAALIAFWIAILVGPLAGYMLGATPTGYLAGRLFKGVDIRQHGSGSTGATNILRTVGKGAALLVILIDMAKGAAAVLLARWLCDWLWRSSGLAPPSWIDLPTATSWVVCLAGLAAVLGHARSVWLKFTGGKSAAAGLGILLAMAWPVGLGAAAAVVVVLALSRIMSLGSMLGALTAVALVLILDEPLAYRLLVIAGAAYVIFLHRANIRRLLAGTEPRIGGSATQTL